MTTITIDERIREKARHELQERINRAHGAYACFALVNVLVHIPPNTDRMSGDQLLRIIDKAIFERQKANAEENAVSNFMEKIESLEEQLDELRGEVGDNA